MKAILPFLGTGLLAVVLSTCASGAGSRMSLGEFEPIQGVAMLGENYVAENISVAKNGNMLTLISGSATRINYDLV